jgi:hypothetical protein
VIFLPALTVATKGTQMLDSSRVAVGRIVHFTYCEYSAPIASELGGNQVKPGDVEAAVIVKVWDATTGGCNLKVLRDGPVDFWATSRLASASDGSEPGFWHFPVAEAVRPPS